MALLVHYTEKAPESHLTPWIECGWSAKSEIAVEYCVPPDGRVDIVYDQRQGLRVVGAMTRTQEISLAAGVSYLGVRLRPGMAASFLGVSVAEFTDGFSPLEDLWPSRVRQLHQRLSDAASLAEARTVLLGQLTRPLVVTPSPIQQAILSIVASNGHIDVEKVASQANLSPRHFRRRCREESGLAPKLLGRILRFRHAHALARSVVRPNWAAIATEANYFDQAHLIRDFREFTGQAPMAVLSNLRSSHSE